MSTVSISKFIFSINNYTLRSKLHRIITLIKICKLPDPACIKIENNSMVLFSWPEKSMNPCGVMVYIGLVYDDGTWSFGTSTLDSLDEEKLIKMFNGIK